jgi:rare lipoprotein A (peptidoglycan hydrolase)
MIRSHRLGKLNIALVALFGLGLLASAALVVGRADSASAASGGLGIASKQSSPAAGTTAVRGTRFGARVLRQGMTGADVTVLKSIVRSKRLLAGRLNGTFDRPTTSAVRRFQNSADMASSGVVNPATAKAMVRSLGTGHASWYGPGLYGNGTACGKVTLRPSTIGLAHKTLPCGTRVLIGFRGKYIIAPVIDRGPYIAGRTWDLTAAAAKAVGLTSAGVGTVRHAIISRGK